MSRLRWTLTKQERVNYAKIAEHLRMAGAELDVSTFQMGDRPWISLTYYPDASSVRVMPSACVLIISLRIVALAQKLELLDIDVSSPDWPLSCYVHDEPGASNSAGEFWSLVGGTRFHESEVLKHHLGERNMLRRGDIVEGLLLADSLVKVPDRYTDQALMRLCVSVTNQFEQVHEENIEVRVEQISVRAHPQTAHQGGGLYEGGDLCSRSWSTSIRSGIRARSDRHDAARGRNHISRRNFENGSGSDNRTIHYNSR